MIALIRTPSPRMKDCLRSDLSLGPIDLDRALLQHAGYHQALLRQGVSVRVLEASPQSPDCVFIEDTAVILDELAIVCLPGHPSRRQETAAVEPVLREYREVRRIELPATIDGGDVLRIGKRIFVGLSSRTNAAGAEALQALAAPLGYQVTAIPLSAGLHLKSACTGLPDGRVLLNPAWINRTEFSGLELVEVPAEEPHAANVLAVGNAIIAPSSYPRTIEKLRQLGFSVDTIPLDEFAKADGCATCLSLLLNE